MSEVYRNNLVVAELLKRPGGERIEMHELIQIIDQHDSHLEAKIRAQIANGNLEHEESRVRLSMKVTRLNLS